VKRHLYCVALFIVLTVCFICPMVEMFDQWHDTIETGSDTEYTVVVLALCIPVAVSFSRFFQRAARLVRAATAQFNPQKSPSGVSEAEFAFVFMRATSPPITSLRI
jgi:hypothetical protein